MIDLIDLCGAVIIFASLGLGWCAVDLLYVKPKTRRAALIKPRGDMLPGKFDVRQFDASSVIPTPNETRKPPDRSWIEFETRTWGGKVVKTLQDTYKAQGEWVGLATERPVTSPVTSSAAPATSISAEIRNLPAVVAAVEQHTESMTRRAYISPEIELQD